MGTQSDGYVEQELLTTFVTCEGDLSDPQFNTKFARLLKQLKKLLLKDSGEYLGVVKVEPWNSVRVTFTVPKEAALRLRQLAQQGDATLSQLGILSVQLEGDQAISLRIAGRVSGESQEIVLRTTTADNDGMGSQTSTPNSDHLISKSVVVSAPGGPASFIRTMTQLVSGSGVNQSLTSFKSPGIVSSVNSNVAFSVLPKVSSSAVISTNTKTSVPHSYHSPFLSPNPLSQLPVLSAQNRESTPSLNNSNSHRFSLPPPPPYPNKTPATSHLVKLNRTLSEDASANPSPPNAALNSPLLVNLLQNDGGVPLNICKPTTSDKQKLKTSNVKAAVPASTVKRKDSTSETLTNVNQIPGSDNLSFVGLNTESPVIQRIQRTPTSISEPLTMVTNVRMPLETCNSESVIVSSSKLPAMNHLTAATANVKQTYVNQSQLVNIFPRQLVPAPAVAASVSSQSKSAISSSSQYASRVAAGPSDNQQLLTVGQGPKFGVRVINVQSPQQQQLLQSQQITQKQLLQQPFPSHHPQQQQLILQQQQQLLQQQKSVILSQSTPNAKIINSVELNKLSVNQNGASPVASSIMVSGNRLVNQFPLNSLPQQISLPSSTDSKYEIRNAFVESQNVTSELTDKTNYIPVSGIVMADNTSCQINKSEGAGPLQNSNRIGIDSIVTCAALQLVKSFTFTNSNASASSNLPVGSLQDSKLLVHSKQNTTISSHEKLNISQTILSSIPNSVFNASSSVYHNAVVTNSSSPSADKYFDQNAFSKGSQINEFQSVVFANSETNVISEENKMFQMSKASAPVSTIVSYSANLNGTSINSCSSVVTTNTQPSSAFSGSITPQLPQYSQTLANSEVYSSNREEGSSTADTNNSSALNSQSPGEKEPQFLINPLTGEMEAMPNESSDNESDNQTDIFNSLPPSVANNDDSCFSFSPPTINDRTNSMYSDEDDDISGTTSSKKDLDQSGPETMKFGGDFTRHRVFSTGSSPGSGSGNEKIKIRLKLEKSEPICSAYKVDVLNSGVKKVDKPTSIVKPMPRVLTTSASSTANCQNTIINSGVDEPRVPPIRLSLRGKNLAFVKKNKKWSEDSKEAAVEDCVEKKSYFKNKMSPCEMISEKECLSSDSIDMCRSPVKISKMLDGGDDTEELKPKVVRNKKSLEHEDGCITSHTEAVGETVSTYSSCLPSVRTFPTEAEVTSILRSVPMDPHNKMSLSSMKIKKKEGKKKLFARERTSLLSNSTLGEDVADTFTRVINETKCTLSQSRGKSKSNPTSLYKKVMKSGAADARFLNLAANRGVDKKGGPMPGELASNVISKTNITATSVHQRRSSADITYTTSSGSLSNVKLNQKVETINSVQYAASSHVTNNLYASVSAKDVKKLLSNSVAGKKVANNCKSRDYPNAKNEIRKEFHLNHESKKGGHFTKKNTLETECKQNVVVNCLQVESNPSINSIANLQTAHLELSEKMMKQRLLDDGAFGEPTRKKLRLDNIEGSTKNTTVLDRLIALPNKEIELSINSTGGESPSGHTTEQTNNQGEDSGIESMDALSEKSPNQGESPCRKEDKDSSVMVDSKKSSVNAYCEKPTIDVYSENFNASQRNGNENDKMEHENGEALDVAPCTNGKCNSETPNRLEAYTEENVNHDKNDNKSYERTEPMSPDLDDVQPFRVTPALYTYSNPEKIRNDSPSPVLEDITDEISMSPKSIVIEQPKTSTRLKRKRKETNDPMFITEKSKSSSGTGRYNNRSNVGLAGKSLLEQLLIEIPAENNAEIRRTGVSTRNTRSQVKGLSQPSPDTLSVCSTSSSSSIKTPKCSPVPRTDDISTKQSPRPSSRLTSRRSRKGSESSNVSNNDESSSFGLSKRKSSENATELIKACIGFDDQNGKKIAISAPASVDCYRPVIGENNIIASPSVVVSSGKTEGTRSTSGVGNKKTTNLGGSNENISQSGRNIGKRRRTLTETENRKTGLKTTALDCVQADESEGQEQESKQLSVSLSSLSSNSPRGNNRLTNSSTANARPVSSTPSTSRRSVRQNHVTRRRKSPGSTDAANPTIVNTNNANNNNNCTNKNNNNSGKVGVHNNEASRNFFHEKNCVSLGVDKVESKTPSKVNYVTKKEPGSSATSGNVCNSVMDTKSNGGSSFSSNATVTTRGSSVKQTLLINDSATTAPPQDVSHTHTLPVSEEVINTRRKTRSIAHSNDSEYGNKRRRNSRDGK